MKKLNSITRGFITNSSTISSLILLEKDTTMKQICDENIVKKMIETKFEQFTRDDLNITITYDVLNNFLERVKKEIPKCTKLLCDMLNKQSDKLPQYIELSIDISRGGDGLDIDQPEKYAMFFVLKYILSKQAINYDENLI